MSDDREAEAPVESGAVNVGDPATVGKARQRAKRKLATAEEEAREFWVRMLGDPVGRREIWGILESGHAFDERFVHGPNGFPQPEATWCYAGEQRLAFRIYLSMMKLAPEGVAMMMSEHHPALVGSKPRRG